MSEPRDTTPTVAVAVFDDHRKTCEDLRNRLNGTPGFRCVLAALSLRNAVERVEKARPDVVILDIRFPRSSGLEALADIKSARPHQRILMQTAIDSGDEILMAYRLGASGYVLKGDGRDRVLEAVQIVADGCSIFSPSIAREMQRLTLGSEDSGWVLRLTPAEVEVLDLLSQGLTAPEIARRRGASVSTVHKQCEAIRGKAEFGNMRQVIAQVAPWARILRKFWNLRNRRPPRPPKTC